MASKELIRRVAESNDIVEIIGGYVQLTRAGSEFRALSPFSTERTPSFYVIPAKQAFYCFSSQQGGDVFRFLMLYENLTFPEALKKLAERCGIRIEENEITPEMAAKDRHRRRVRELQVAVREWYHLLLVRSPLAEEARHYLKGRGIGIEVAKRWKLGYAPESPKLFLDWARKNGYSPELLVDGGLCMPSKSGKGVWVHFRRRLMFPIHNDYGEPVGFSGRNLFADQPGGKYINSPETIIFEKSKMFFGLDKSKQAILKAGHAILCEGQLDLIAAFEAGVTNIVAPLGTAFTEGQARLLARHTKEVLVCFDADGAGQRATSKAFEKLAPAGITVRVVPIPTGEDPDSLIRKGGAEAFRTVVAQAEDYFDFLIRIRGASGPGATIAQRVDLAGELTGKVALVADPILRATMLQNLSTRLGVAEEQLAHAVKKVTAAANKRDEARQQAAPETWVGSHVMRTFCRLLLTSPAARAWVLEHADRAILGNVANASLARVLWEGDFSPADPASVPAFLAGLPDDQQNAIGRLLVEGGPEGAVDLAEDCWLALRREGLENRVAERHARLARTGPDDPDLFTLLLEIGDLQKEVRQLPPPRPLPSE